MSGSEGEGLPPTPTSEVNDLSTGRSLTFSTWGVFDPITEDIELKNYEFGCLRSKRQCK